MKFSIITPLFNSSEYILSFISHHLKNEILQKYQIEIIFVDDCSRDNSVELLRSNTKNINNCRILINKNNLGPGVSRFIGANEAKGEFLIFIDIDDKVNLKEKVDIQYKMMIKNRYEWSFTQFIINKKNQIGLNLNINNINQILRYRYIAMSTVMIKKNLFLKYEKFKYFSSYSCEDYIVWIQLALNNKFPLYVSETTMIYRVSNSGLSRNKLKQAITVLKVYIELLGLRMGLKNFLYYVKNNFLKYFSLNLNSANKY